MVFWRRHSRLKRWANWETREYFAEQPSEFVTPFLPTSRASAHINVAAFLTEIMRTSPWRSDRSNLSMCGITDNSTSNMRYVKWEAKRGAGLQSTRNFHMWLINQRFRTYSFYFRSARNIAADFLSRASPVKNPRRAEDHNMVRIDPRARWAQFCCPILPHWPETRTSKRSQISHRWPPGTRILHASTISEVVAETRKLPPSNNSMR